MRLFALACVLYLILDAKSLAQFDAIRRLPSFLFVVAFLALAAFGLFVLCL